MIGSVDPRLVVGDVDHQIRLHLAGIEIDEHGTAVRSAARQRRELLRVRHHGITRIQFHTNDIVLKRQHFGITVLAQEGSGHQGGHIDAAHLAGSALADTRHSGVHGPGHVRRHDHLPSHHRHVGDGNLHRILQRLLHLVRDFRADVEIGGQELVREHLGAAHLILMAQAAGNKTSDLLDGEHAVTGEGVQVHARHLPRGTTSDGLPLLRRQRQGGEHLERHVRRISRRVGFPGLELAHDAWQCRSLMLATNEVTIERLTAFRGRVRVHHFHDVCQRRRLPHVGTEDGLVRAGLEPAAHEALWQRAEGFTTRHAGAEDLHEVAQHLGVIDHAIKDEFQTFGITGGQHGAEQSRHVLHETLLAAVKRGAGDEVGRDFLAELQHLLELIFRRGVIGAVQATRGRILSQRMTWRELIGLATGFIEAVSLGSQSAAEGRKERFASHDVGLGWSFVCANTYC